MIPVKQLTSGDGSKGADISTDPVPDLSVAENQNSSVDQALKLEVQSSYYDKAVIDNKNDMATGGSHNIRHD